MQIVSQVLIAHVTTATDVYGSLSVKRVFINLYSRRSSETVPHLLGTAGVLPYGQRIDSKLAATAAGPALSLAKPSPSRGLAVAIK